MNIVDFGKEHIEQAIQIAIDNYHLERRQITALPEFTKLPEKLVPVFEHYAVNGLCVAAVDDTKLTGFLCTYLPREDAFGTTLVRGTFAAVHAHGVAVTVTGKERDRIYSKLYQAAAAKWVNAGIRSHAIAIYAHDRTAINSFFYNGFGLRCLDLIRSLEQPLLPNTTGLDRYHLKYVEVPRAEWNQLLQLHNALIKHLGESPTFMCFPPMDEAALYAQAPKDVRYFAAIAGEEYAAYIKISDTAENFITEHPAMLNICGAYCSPEFRGLGIYHNLLSFLTDILRQEGYQLLGVDCESFNPNARGFWSKYFTEYTNSVVRRIDEKAVDAAISETGK